MLLIYFLLQENGLLQNEELATNENLELNIQQNLTTDGCITNNIQKDERPTTIIADDATRQLITFVIRY